MQSTTETNKAIARAFYEAAINRKDFAAASVYLGRSYRQHNPGVADGPQGLEAFIAEIKVRYPRQRGEIKRIAADGDLVWLHIHSTRDDGTPGRAIVDIFRIEDGKVVEHWDVIQHITGDANNPNGMF